MKYFSKPPLAINNLVTKLYYCLTSNAPEEIIHFEEILEKDKNVLINIIVMTVPAQVV